MRTLFALFVAVALIGCATEPKQTPEIKTAPPLQQAAAGPYPEDFELRIISWLRMNADDPDNVQILSIGPPQPKTLEVSAPDRGLVKGDAVWESIAVVQSKTPPGPPAYRRFYFKDGVIRAVDLK